jgi:hypothetical protein
MDSRFPRRVIQDDFVSGNVPEFYFKVFGRDSVATFDFFLRASFVFKRRVAYPHTVVTDLLSLVLGLAGQSLFGAEMTAFELVKVGDKVVSPKARDRITRTK